ncbi:hypothetical protein ACIQXM_01990 [Arthrobacter sp. NPDC097144]|uniref:hypothetical protein n=1 Tax=Arthrobacter sp. NPDC097144 TaxID=3363946 RepID=UPI003825AA06
MAIDFSTPVGRVRLLIADLDESAFLLSNEVVDAYLGFHEENVYRAAADAMDAMATSDVLLSRKIRTQDLQTDGPAVATDLRKRAAELRARADAEDAKAADTGDVFEVIPFHPYGKPEGAEARW